MSYRQIFISRAKILLLCAKCFKNWTNKGSNEFLPKPVDTNTIDSLIINDALRTDLTSLISSAILAGKSQWKEVQNTLLGEILGKIVKIHPN